MSCQEPWIRPQRCQSAARTCCAVKSEKVLRPTVRRCLHCQASAAPRTPKHVTARMKRSTHQRLR